MTNWVFPLTTPKRICLPQHAFRRLRPRIEEQRDHDDPDQRGKDHRKGAKHPFQIAIRSEEHTSELQSLMRISYAVFCLKKKKNKNKQITNNTYKHPTIKKLT